ncbi:MAG TPA: Gfo/Idh/MocA family oxidoreductase [Fimbriiglobus sp.]|nr:Gfo/Idh/MocA family oxidoreductase [Fimbriiglobus sp.]
MALDLTAEQKDTGRRNFEAAAGELTRRGFMKSMAAGAAVVPLSAAVYYGYDSWKGNKAVKTAVIGTGDEGGVLIGDHNPEFLEVVAVSDIRPYNQKRIFEGEPSPSPRKGLNHIYGKDTAQKIRQFGHYEELLDPAVIKSLGLEAVVIALPLHMHDEVAIKCMKAGLHVLCEKLMARSVSQCKDMIKAATDPANPRLLAIGHQRHYSMLYAHALEIVKSGVLGDIKHIRALWHRNNSWPYDPKSEKEPVAEGFTQPYYRDSWFKAIYKEDADALKDPALLKKYGFNSMEELVRWRIYDRTGGGLMAELGSHQLDAASIFLGKVRPLAVMGVGGKFFYGPGRNDRESDDGVWVTYEFPGPKHPKAGKGGTDESDLVVVTYSSFNTNSFESYGECLMGSRGTMIVEQERDVYLFKEPQPGKAKSGGKETNVAVTAADGKKPVMEASSTWGGAGAAVTKQANAPKWDSDVRGYRSEMEHFAYCVRKWDAKLGYRKDKDGKYEQELPHCHGEVAMADAILALTANMAMGKRVRIEFDPKWFQPDTPDVPEAKYGKNGLA